MEHTGGSLKLVVEPLDELTQKQHERLVKLARKVLSGELDAVWIERSYKGHDLRITPYKTAA